MNAKFQAALNAHKQAVAEAAQTITLTQEQLDAIIEYKIADKAYTDMMEREGRTTGFVLTPEWNAQWEAKKQLYTLKCNHIVGVYAGNSWN